LIALLTEATSTIEIALTGPKQLEKGQIGLLIVYAKAKFDNLPSDFLSLLKQEFIND
jgi:hypothetical protein